MLLKGDEKVLGTATIGVLERAVQYPIVYTTFGELMSLIRISYRSMGEELLTSGWTTSPWPQY